MLDDKDTFGPDVRWLPWMRNAGAEICKPKYSIPKFTKYQMLKWTGALLIQHQAAIDVELNELRTT